MKNALTLFDFDVKLIYICIAFEEKLFLFEPFGKF